MVEYSNDIWIKIRRLTYKKTYSKVPSALQYFDHFKFRRVKLWMLYGMWTYPRVAFQGTIIEYRKGVYRLTNESLMIPTSIKLPCEVSPCWNQGSQ